MTQSNGAAERSAHVSRGAPERIEARCAVCGNPLGSGFGARVFPPFAESCSPACHAALSKIDAASFRERMAERLGT